MGRKYAVDGKESAVTVNNTILGVTSAATIRPVIYDVLVSSDAAPADNSAGFVLQRYTVAGTSTPVTPQALDPADPAALAAAGENHSIEPTYTTAPDAIVLSFAMNQRAVFRWVAAPEGGLRMPATAANGIGLKPIVVNSMGATVATFHFEE